MKRELMRAPERERSRKERRGRFWLKARNKERSRSTRTTSAGRQVCGPARANISQCRTPVVRDGWGAGASSHCSLRVAVGRLRKSHHGSFDLGYGNALSILQSTNHRVSTLHWLPPGSDSGSNTGRRVKTSGRRIKTSERRALLQSLSARRGGEPSKNLSERLTPTHWIPIFGTAESRAFSKLPRADRSKSKCDCPDILPVTRIVHRTMRLSNHARNRLAMTRRQF